MRQMFCAEYPRIPGSWDKIYPDNCFTGYYERLLLSGGKAPSGIDHTENTGMIRDLYMLEFLNLSEPYKEFDLKQAILKNMKQFLLEFTN